jgi:hypothetical protein
MENGQLLDFAQQGYHIQSNNLQSAWMPKQYYYIETGVVSDALFG